MPGYVISCGCGRTMSPDGRGGRGAYRCGCGARIVIRDAPAMNVSCSAQGCRTASVTGAKIRLCADHKDEITMVLAQDVARTDIKNLVGLQEQGAGRWKAPAIPVYRGVEVAPTDAAIVRELPPSGQHDPIVYFLLNGDRVRSDTPPTCRRASRRYLSAERM